MANIREHGESPYSTRELKKIMPLSAVCGACVLLISDVLGRIWGSPGELESGIVTALIGGPVFIFIIRKVRVRSL